MNNLANYFIESGLALGIFYMTYHLFLQDSDRHGLKRSYLIGTLLFSLVIPLKNFTLGPEVPVSYYPMILLDEVIVRAGDFKAGGGWNGSLGTVLWIIYLTGAAFFSTKLVLSVHKLRQVIRNAEKDRFNGVPVHYVTGRIPTFTFINRMVVNRENLDEDEIRIIMQHEAVHMREGHHYDLIILQVLQVLFWFNPFLYLYRNSLQEIHEYLADRNVLDRFDPDDYKLLILKQSIGQLPNRSLTHSFNQQLIFKRLNMMNALRKPKKSAWKFLLVLPLAALTFFLFACESGEREVAETPDTTQKTETIVYEEVDKMPEYPGGMMEMRRFIAGNVQYPEESRETGVQGRIYVAFVVDEHGELIKGKTVVEPPETEGESGFLSDPSEGIVVVGFRNVEGDDTEYSADQLEPLIKESIRVVEKLGSFEPALKDGKPVPVQLTVPITFVLQ